ncbi:Putative nuclease HARBI1 [Araneus ventricosus]|uniref:Nuclease HARBI1 n=1 Tax=Araneus ventricosus TaxID=182803 RepID=A0A4Y2TQ51_ARAVE|nr:Putative nuclease HARBI1 [Araneus ventricosus]
MESKKGRKVKKRKDLFVELDDYDFRRRFRLTKEGVVELTLLIHEKLEIKSTLNNALSAVEQVLIALRFYAVASMQFEVSQPTVSRVVLRVSEAIASLLPDYIYLPVNKEECQEKCFDISGFPSVIGALDCTFVRIVSPGGKDSERFRCRKNYFALNAQTIVNSDLVIRNVVARWPGITHDSTIFTNSAACLTLQTNSSFRNYHLLGDSRLDKYLLTPFVASKISCRS